MGIAIEAPCRPENGIQDSSARSETAFRSLELFTGAGGLALGTRAAGFEHVGLVEWNQDACATLRANLANEPLSAGAPCEILQADVRAVDFARFAPIDLVAGGPPCQPFSIGGKHRGMDDQRNMIGEYIRAVGTLAPRAFILENVRGLLRSAFRDYFSYVLTALTSPTVGLLPNEEWVDHHARLRAVQKDRPRSEPRYNVSYRLVNAADYGIPQSRVRIFVVGFRSDLEVAWHFPDPTHSLDALRQAHYGTGEYWDEHDLPRPKTFIRTPFHPEDRNILESPPRRRWHTTRDALLGLPEPLAHEDAPGILNHRLIPGARSYPGHTGSDLDRPAKTLKAGGHGVPGGENMLALPDGTVRYLTIREAARLQTFPDAWRFEGAWGEIMRQLGNAVPMELARVVAMSVAASLTLRGG